MDEKAKFVLRIPRKLNDKLRAEARKLRRTKNEHIVFILENRKVGSTVAGENSAATQQVSEYHATAS